ncbi:uncharacterized protein LOC122711511 [Apis laboriosa]|uniref:uncharacterized protein LOC122711511 n=1 Tax=Apis laboriosa TaxID=183418 RepID=UPI001CC3E1BE|nr:uncharacterized protein LOC122711511 [Apis laboriosa]
MVFRDNQKVKLKTQDLYHICFCSSFIFLYLMRSTFILTGRATMTDCESTSGSWRLFTKIRACVSRGREAGSRTEDRAAVGRACGGSWMVAACQNRCRQGAEREDELGCHRANEKAAMVTAAAAGRVRVTGYRRG